MNLFLVYITTDFDANHPQLLGIYSTFKLACDRALLTLQEKDEEGFFLYDDPELTIVEMKIDSSKDIIINSWRLDSGEIIKDEN